VINMNMRAAALRLCAVFALGVSIVSAAGCSSDSTATTPTSPSGPVTENIGGAVTVGGLTSHAFTTASAGTITVTLSSLSVPSTVVGLGLGVYNAANYVCSLTTSLNTAPGTTAQISATVDTGTYCVEIYDIGTLGVPQGFSISIVHP
jgi:hypothetical protein